MSTASQGSSSYGGLGIALVRALAEQGHSTFTTAQARDAAGAVGVTDSYLPVLLHRLQRSGWLRRLKHGTYSMTTGLPGVAEAHAFAIGMALVEPCAISGWAALHHHGFTEQIPQVVTLTTPKRVVTPAMRGAVKAAPSTWNVGADRFEIVVVVAAHFFGFEETWIDGARVRIFDRERALLDCFALPRRFGGLAEGLGILDEHLREVNVEHLVAHALEYDTAAVSKRIGYALERLHVGAGILDPLRALPSRGYRALDPSRTPRGPRNRRWGLIENLSSPRNRA